MLSINDPKKKMDEISRHWMLALFSSICWAVAVIFFEPYGSHIRDDEFFQMLTLTFLPTAVVLGLFWMRINKLSKRWRVALFSSICWTVAVVIFVIVFEPYGSRIGGDELFHMLTLIFLPAVVALGLFGIYESFVR